MLGAGFSRLDTSEPSDLWLWVLCTLSPFSTPSPDGMLNTSLLVPLPDVIHTVLPVASGHAAMASRLVLPWPH